MKFICIVVLYNVNYKDSVSYMDLIETDYYRQGKMKIVCVDNSVKDFGNDELVSAQNHFYVNMHGNKGLAQAYNAAIERFIKESAVESLVVLLDDDTHIGKDYFEKMELALDPEFDVYLPIVLDQKGILSPGVIKARQYRRCARLGQVNERNICGINSGMAIRSKVFQNYRYNEDMFLDYVDHAFLRDIKRFGKKIKVVDTTLHQNFSAVTDSYEQTIKRFLIFKKDIKVFYSRDIVDKMIYYYTVLKRKIGIFLKFRKVSVFWKY